MKKLILFLFAISTHLNGFSQICELVAGESVTIEFANFSITNITDNGSDCTLEYTLDYIINNPNNCGVSFQSVVKTDAGSQTTFTMTDDGAWHTETGTIYNTACSGNSFIQISGGWGHPCTYVGIPWPGVTCASVSYSSATLPVELIDFKAKINNDQIDLSWSTSSETNNKLFIIEQSANGTDFKEIGTREGANNSSSLKGYSFTHQQPDLGANYYRLKQVDLNGDFEYSDIVIMEFNNSTSWIDVFPNPTFDKVNFILSPETTGTFEIYNHTGQLMQGEKNFNAKTSISLKRFPTGWYILNFTTNKGNQAHRIFKR